MDETELIGSGNPDDSSPLPGGNIPLQDISKRYTRLKEIGAGGMGIVHSAADHLFGRTIALKTLRKKMSAKDETRFKREGSILARLAHPNIVPVHDMGFDEAEMPCIAMKRVMGDSLKDIFAREPRSPNFIPEAVEILIQVCRALSYAHENAIVHLDIKPGNIMVGAHGQVYLMDWGMARRVGSSGAGGTTSYMAPEQANQEAVDGRTDVFAVGAILYELLVGRPPFKRDTGALSQYAAQNCIYIPIEEACTGFPKGLARIAKAAMSPSLKDRIQNTADLAKAMNSFLRGAWLYEDRHFAEGDILMNIGDDADYAYEIVEGVCSIFTSIDGEDKELTRFGPGRTFGELALIRNSPRSAGVRALTAVTLRAVSRETFQEWLSEGSWMAPIVKGVADRMVELTDELVLEKENNTALNLTLLAFRVLVDCKATAASPIKVSQLLEAMQAHHASIPVAQFNRMLLRPEFIFDDDTMTIYMK